MLLELTLGEKLKDLRVERGFGSTDALAKEVGIPASTLGDYEIDDKNKNVGYANLVVLAKFYGVSMDWLLGLSSTRQPEKSQYSDLGLSDGAIAILKERKINVRMLDEMIVHEKFIDFMASAEVYVNGVVDSITNTLHAILNLQEHKIKETYQPTEGDVNIKSMHAARVHEEIYYSQYVYEKLMGLLTPIRKKCMANKKDHTSVRSEMDPVAMVMDAIENYEKTPGTPEEKMLAICCAHLGQNYSKLKKSDRVALLNFLQKGNKHWRNK